MGLLIAYDRWCEDRVRALLVFLDEWLSISQKNAERGLIALYNMLVFLAEPRSVSGFAVRMFVMLAIGTAMWQLHRRPEALRRREYLSPFHAALRVFLQAFLGGLAIIDLLPPHAASTIAMAQVVYLIFFYMTNITSNGERGQRRKLA